MSSSTSPSSVPILVEEHRDNAIPHIREALAGLKFGVVSIIVQDGVVVQIERTEKRRLRKSSSDTNSKAVG